MKLEVLRYWDNGNATSGLLLIDGKAAAYTLEDEYRKEKLKGETRIPEGTYNIVFRKEGGHHTKYSKAFKNIHKGMLHIINVPKFQYILIHIGNYEKDTDGCLLLGNKISWDGILLESTSAYKRIYPIISKALEGGEDVTITFKNIQP